MFCPLEFQVILAVFPFILASSSDTAVNLDSPPSVEIPATSNPPSISTPPAAVTSASASNIPLNVPTPAVTFKPPAVICTPHPAVTITPV